MGEFVDDFRACQQSGLFFCALGPVAVWRGPTEIDIGSGKHRTLLAALLLHAGEHVSRDLIIDLVWGDRPPRSAVNLVQKYVGDLRRSLGADGQLLELVPGGYRLRLAEHQLDSRAFEVLLEQARFCGDASAAEEGLCRALALWRGRAFHEIDADTATTVRARLDEHRVAAEEELAGLRLARGEHHAVAAELARLSTGHPLRERLRELQMLALYRCGRQAEALAVYADVRTMLADQLGVDPSSRLQRCYERILRGEPEPGPEPPGAVRPTPSCQLPPDLADFTGRADQIATLVHLLAHGADGAPPLVVVIAGAPGVGKTSVAVHAAHTLREAFPDGQLHVDLAGMSDVPREPAAVLAEVLRVLGINGAGVPEELSARAALYRSLLANRRALLVLDDAASAAQVRPLAPGTGQSAVLVTSRHRLPELPGARHLDLDILAPEEAGQLFAGIVGADRVAREPAQAAAILRSCGYLPLAVRIAGAKLASRTTWSLEMFKERLADTSQRLRQLRVGQLEIQASFELSLRHLPDRAVRAFRLLGLIGPHTLPGWVLGPLLGADDVDGDETLDLLVDANLLRPAGTDSLGQPRYRIHDLLRDYAAAGAETMPVPVRTAAVTRLLGTWLELDSRAAAGLPPSLFQPPVGTAARTPAPPAVLRRITANPLAWFDSERSMLAGAVRLAADHALDDHAWELAATTVTYYDHRSHYDDWENTHTTALAAVQAANNRLGEAVLLRALGQVHIYRDHDDIAITQFTRSALLFAELGDKRGEALAIAGLGTVSRLRGDHATALDHARQAHDMLVLADEPHMVAQLRASIGRILVAQGDLAEAKQWFDAALHDTRELGDPHREATVLGRLSAFHERCGEQDEALACLRHAVAIFDELDDEQCAAMYALVPLGRLHAARGERAAAEQSLHRAAGICERHGHRREVAECWQLLGELALRHDDHAPAHQLLRRALELWREIGAVERIGATRDMLARSGS